MQVQKELGEIEGVLPLLDSSADKTSFSGFAWLVTPLAARLDDYLKDKDPKQAVAAVAQIASTLAELHERGIAHRDVKPANLFWFQDRACLGDLGLVSVPDTKTLAEDGRVPGAFGFIADELLVCEDPSVLSIADWQAADVFALAKSLWALVAALPFAPQGHIAVTDHASSLHRRLVVDGAAELDLIIDNATLPASVRLSMDTLARGLTAWLNRAPTSALPGDIQESLTRLKASMRSGFDARDARAHREAALQEALTVLVEEAQDLEAVIRQVDSQAEAGSWAAGSLRDQTEFAEYLGGPVIEATEHWGVRLERADGGLDRVLVIDFCLQITEQGQVMLEGLAMCGHERVIGGGVYYPLGPLQASMRSVELNEAIRQLVSGACVVLPELVKAMT